MKKYLFILLIGAALALSACGSKESTTNGTTDSTSVSQDSLTQTPADTTGVQ